jgi:hypothetical protein
LAAPIMKRFGILSKSGKQPLHGSLVGGTQLL